MITLESTVNPELMDTNQENGQQEQPRNGVAEVKHEEEDPNAMQTSIIEEKKVFGFHDLEPSSIESILSEIRAEANAFDEQQRKSDLHRQSSFQHPPTFAMNQFSGFTNGTGSPYQHGQHSPIAKFKHASPLNQQNHFHGFPNGVAQMQSPMQHSMHSPHQNALQSPPANSLQSPSQLGMMHSPHQGMHHSSPLANPQSANPLQLPPHMQQGPPKLLHQQSAPNLRIGPSGFEEPHQLLPLASNRPFDPTLVEEFEMCVKGIIYASARTRSRNVYRQVSGEIAELYSRVVCKGQVPKKAVKKLSGARGTLTENDSPELESSFKWLADGLEKRKSSQLYETIVNYLYKLRLAIPEA